jgi:hypothetical protein
MVGAACRGEARFWYGGGRNLCDELPAIGRYPIRGPVVVPSGPLTADEVIEYGKKHVAGPSHKVLKRELKERYS